MSIQQEMFQSVAAGRLFGSTQAMFSRLKVTDQSVSEKSSAAQEGSRGAFSEKLSSDFRLLAPAFGLSYQNEQGIVSLVGRKVMNMLRLFSGSQEDRESVMNFIEDLQQAGGFKKLPENIFNLLNKLALVAGLPALSLNGEAAKPTPGFFFNPKPHSFDVQNRPSGPRPGA